MRRKYSPGVSMDLSEQDLCVLPGVKQRSGHGKPDQCGGTSGCVAANRPCLGGERDRAVRRDREPGGDHVAQAVPLRGWQ